ncbi:hypothetical protein TrLO_g10068 [Triparma laevis f. longispina]|uniref:Uncharacterized protein n=1 Tax=Triparma laevis f. longispina TaxID=1714387 RepID=A0A9W7CCI0_9STRA|nr:hypothetical protein TrLO_g10068 [Triparma laevis f. longispina]
MNSSQSSAESAALAKPAPYCAIPTCTVHPTKTCSRCKETRYCTHELMSRSQPCPICRKPISDFDVGVYSIIIGKRGLWPTSYKHLRQLASGEGFNEYFQKQFNGNEAAY